MALLMGRALVQAANGAAPRKRGWFGRKNKAATPAATNDPAAPGTPAANAGAPGTGTATGTPAVGPHTTTGVDLTSAHVHHCRRCRFGRAQCMGMPSKVAID